MRSIDRFAVTAAVLAMLAPVAAGADALVVRASGPAAATYPVGRKLPDSARLRLGPDDSLTLIDARERGYCAGLACSAPARRRATAVAARSDTGRVRIGAVRSMSIVAPVRPDRWSIDVSKPGPVCLIKNGALALWRPRTTAPATVVIAPAAGGAPTSASWDAGQSTVAWPSGPKPADTTRFSLTQAGSAPVEITIRLIAAPGDDLPRTAAALLGAGCQAQLDELVATPRMGG